MTDSLIDAAFEDEIGLLQALVRTPTDNPPGDCADAAVLLADRLGELGLPVEPLPVPDPFARQHGMKSVINLLTRRTFGEGTGPVVALHAPGDTVPPGERWHVDPYGGLVRDGALYGRGAVESKADIAAYVYALLALETAGAELDGTVELHLTFDEERGGFLGPQWLLSQGLTKPDMVIAAGWTHQVVVGQGGCLHLEVVVRGRQAHASRPAEGCDALAATVPILSALYAERDRLARMVPPDPELGRPTLSIGTISGGLATNLIPDRVTLRLDRRILPDENGEQVEGGLIRLVEEAGGGADGIEVECRRILLAEPLRRMPGASRLADVIREAAKAVLHKDIPAITAPVVSGARFYAEAGIPTVLYGAGPAAIGEGHEYGVNEHVRLDDLRDATKVVARTLTRLLSAGRP